VLELELGLKSVSAPMPILPLLLVGLVVLALLVLGGADWPH
jgi:hypothetical protein